MKRGYPFIRLLGTALAAGILVAGFSSCALIGMIVGTATVHITNDYSVAIRGVYSTAVSSDSWGDNLITKSIGTHESRDVTLVAATRDFMFTFVDLSESEVAVGSAIIERDQQYNVRIDERKWLTYDFGLDAPGPPATAAP